MQRRSRAVHGDAETKPLTAASCRAMERSRSRQRGGEAVYGSAVSQHVGSWNVDGAKGRGRGQLEELTSQAVRLCA